MNHYDKFDIPAYLMAEDTDSSVIPDPDVTSEDLEEEEELDIDEVLEEADLDDGDDEELEDEDDDKETEE